MHEIQFLATLIYCEPVDGVDVSNLWILESGVGGCLGNDIVAGSQLEASNQFLGDKGIGRALTPVFTQIEKLSGLLFRDFEDTFNLYGLFVIVFVFVVSS